MKYLAILLIILISVALLGIFYYEENLYSKKQRLKNVKSVGSENSFVACTLTSYELIERRKTLLPAIQPFIEDIKELENGYLFKFRNDDDLLPKLLEVIDIESICCSFLEFNLKVEANKGPIWLQLTGQKGTKEFIKENFMPN
ncbi:hypothetical protein E3V55_06070 [Candidatus Marinimicrobia bacterium MT.SAG.3]|nr:hypothetical protein E3V55_06070 [Candidatus Marinimicrobia bacterium MT.SAG.3]